MRIISGNLKGKPISFRKISNTRPLKDSVKENIFNILMHSKLINVNLKNANILDLYSGIGSFGLEALSRGAKNVTFVEKNSEATSVLKENIKTLGVQNKATVFENEITYILEKKKLKKFDIFFMDPPFADTSFINELRLIKKNKIFKKKNIVIIHRERKSNDDLDKNLSVFLVKTYGRSKILFANFLT